jgi:SAM-dependent methyltransferase
MSQQNRGRTEFQKKFDQNYNIDYFTDRNSNDPRRIKAFKDESKLIAKYINRGYLLDIGCSTGEFYDYVSWEGEKYGVEVSSYASEKAKERGIITSKNIPDNKDFFDLVLLRGTIQHLDSPFNILQKIQSVLKADSYLIFLSTPNSNSIYYKLWGELPALDNELNFLIPSDIMLKNALQNMGFDFIEARYPYFKSPYSNFLSDHFKFMLKIFGCKVSFAFHKSMMDLVFRKK